MSRGLLTPFFFISARYIKIDKQRVYLVAGTPEERAKWRQGKRMKVGVFRPSHELKEELAKLMLSEHNTPQGCVMTVGELVPMCLRDCQQQLLDRSLHQAQPSPSC